jgi:surface-anchored protein
MNAVARSARSLAPLAVAVSLAFAVAARAEPIILSSGHVDIFEAEYELHEGEPELHLGVHAGEEPGTHYEPGAVILQVKNAAYRSTSGLPSAITDILGPNAWILPADAEEAGNLGVIDAGIGRKGDFPDSTAVTFTLLSAGANPGNFVLFNTSNPNQIRLSATGSTVGTNSFTLTAGHIHWNWGFSAAGTYTFEMRASYNDPVEGLLQSPAETYTFQVVPEPSTWALAGTAALGAIGLGRRFRRPGA